MTHDDVEKRRGIAKRQDELLPGESTRKKMTAERKEGKMDCSTRAFVGFNLYRLGKENMRGEYRRPLYKEKKK
jgi:hypothetical protein